MTAPVERCPGKIDLAASILDQFEPTARSRVDQMATFAADGQVAQLQNEAHTLKGLAGIPGASQLQHLAEDVKTAVREFRMDCLESTVTGLSTEMERCLMCLPEIRSQLQRNRSKENSSRRNARHHSAAN